MLPAPPADADAQTHPTPRGGEPERPYPNPPSTVHMAANGSLSLKMKISLEVDNESALPRFLEGRVSAPLHCFECHLIIVLSHSLSSVCIPSCPFQIKNIAILGWPFDNDNTTELYATLFWVILIKFCYHQFVPTNFLPTFQPPSQARAQSSPTTNP